MNKIYYINGWSIDVFYFICLICICAIIILTILLNTYIKKKYFKKSRMYTPKNEILYELKKQRYNENMIGLIIIKIAKGKIQIWFKQKNPTSYALEAFSKHYAHYRSTDLSEEWIEFRKGKLPTKKFMKQINKIANEY